MTNTILNAPGYSNSRITIFLNILFGTIVFLVFASCQDAQKSSPAKQISSFTDDPSLINDKLFVLSEYEIGMRERALADIVFERTTDAEVKALAKTVREGHQLGIDKLIAIAKELNISLPDKISPAEQAKLDIVRKIPAGELPRFFLIRQKAMHAWDITIFTDYANYAVNHQLKQYIIETQQPLREHAEQVVQLANKKGIEGTLTAGGAQ